MAISRILPRLIALLGVPAALGQAPANVPTPATAPAKSHWVFSILPKSFQKNPEVDLTVVTEMTEFGRKQPVATPATPVYYVAMSSGYHQMGQVSAGEHTLPPADVERLLASALAKQGILRAAPPTHPPTLAIFYTWGSHNVLVESDPDNPTLSAVQVTRNLLDRAALVGGPKFSAQIQKLFMEADTAIGFDPIAQFKQSDPKNEFLFDQLSSDVYYVVASAYDYASLSAKTRQLCWRTRMTVGAQGVSQEQTLATLIASATPFFGKDMSGAEILTRRAVPEGQVEIGTPTVVDPPVKKP